VNGSFVGVDLLPVGDRGWIVLEINGAVELTDDYSFVGDVFAAAAEALSDPRGSGRRRARSAA
jgi:glutathione synthase/RimK-type ligase-like ATP-grasp enzyme